MGASCCSPAWVDHDEIAKYQFEELFESSALLLGWVTYREFAAAWPSRTDEEGFADRMHGLPKYVVSTPLSEVVWHNLRVMKENVTDEGNMEQACEQFAEQLCPRQRDGRLLSPAL